MKKFLVALMCFMCIFSLVGCDKRDVTTPPITMSRYFNSKVVGRVDNKNVDYKISSFIGKTPDEDTIALHESLQFAGVTNWIYNMYVECVYFYFYSSKSVEVNQLTFTMTALDGGVTDSTINNYKVEEVLSLNANKNEGVLLRVNIGHRVTEDDLSLTIALQDEKLLNTQFGWTIYGLQVYGDM